MLFLWIAFLVGAIRKRGWPTANRRVVVIAGFIGVAANTSNLYHTYEYSQETMRGKSELTHHGDANRTGDGLERLHHGLSYGIGETWTLLVPNTKGRIGTLSLNEKAMARRSRSTPALSTNRAVLGRTARHIRPVYVGAFVLTLFVLDSLS